MRASAAGRLERVIAARLGPGEDLLEGIVGLCAEHGVWDGCVLMGMGSLREARIYNPVPSPAEGGGLKFRYPTEPQTCGGAQGALELLSVEGTIWHTDAGEIKGHIHISFSAADGHVTGGHIVPGCTVLTTAELVIGAFGGVDMVHRPDAEAGVPLLTPQAKNY